MPNAVEYEGTVYILNPEPRGDYAPRIDAPYLTKALSDFGIETAPPPSANRPVTNGAAAKALAQKNPNVTGVDYATGFDRIELLEIKLPQGMSAAEAVKALNNYDPKTQTYTNEKIAEEFAQKKAEALAAKSAKNASDITAASGVSPYATVTEQLMVNAGKLDTSQYIVTQQGTSFTVRSRSNETQLTVSVSVDPQFPDRVQLEFLGNDHEGDSQKFRQAVGSKLLDGVLKDTRQSTIQDAMNFVGNRNILADITPEKARKIGQARQDSAKSALLGQVTIDNISIGGISDQVETIPAGVPKNSSGFETLKELLQSGHRDRLHHAEQLVADEILRARTLARIEALREAGHIDTNLRAEDVLKRAGQGATFATLRKAGAEAAEFRMEVEKALGPVSESRGAFIDRITEAERIARRVISDRNFRNGIDILRGSNPDLQAMSPAEIESLVKGLQKKGGPVNLDDLTKAAREYHAYIDNHQPVSDKPITLQDILDGKHLGIKKSALEHAVNPPSLLDELIRKPFKPNEPKSLQGPDKVSPVGTPNPARSTKPQLEQGGSGDHSQSGPSVSQPGNLSDTAATRPSQVPGHPTSPSGPVMNGVGSINAGGANLVDQTAPTMGHAEVLGATALKPKLQEDLRPDIKETPSVGQVAPAHSVSSNDPVYTPSKVKQPSVQAPVTGINTSIPAANADSVAPPKSLAQPAPPPAMVAPPPTETPQTGSNPSTLGKLGAVAGKAEVGLTAAAQVAQGNIAGAATTVAETVATNAAVGRASETATKLLAKQGLKSAGVVVGAAATIGFGSATVIDKAKQGRHAAAAIEGTAVLLEAAGNLLPGGVVGAGLRETFRAAVKNTIGEKYAPEKSGLRQAAEFATDVGNKIVVQSQFKSMSMAKLRDVISHDETLPKTVSINGKNVTLTEALQDKSFRTKFIENLEKAETKGHDLSAQIAMIKAYDTKLSVPPQTQFAALQKPAPQVEMYGI